VVGSCEQCNASLGSIKGREFLNQLRDHYLQEGLCAMELYMKWVNMIKTGI
jgi:hypothetical protein